MRVLARNEKTRDEAARLVSKYVRDEFTTKKEPEYLAAGARLLEELKLPAAEGLYKQYVAEVRAKKPESVLQLASFLARRQRTPEALDLFEGAWLTCKPDAVAAACVNSLVDAQPTAKDFQRAQSQLDQAIKQHPDATLLPMALANIYIMQDQPGEAEAIYRSVHARNPKNVMVLNNLAWLVTMHGGHPQEGLELIAKALESAAPRRLCSTPAD